MGAWGYKIDENDSYLDISGELIDAFAKKAVRLADIKKWDMHDELNFTSYVGILCLLTKNQVCKVDSKQAEIIIERLENLIADRELLHNWTRPEKRKAEIQKLLRRFISANDLE